MQSRLAFGLFVALMLSGLVRGRTSPASVQRNAAKAREDRAQAYSLYTAGRYREAEQAYEASYERALSRGDGEEAFRCLNGLGGARFAMFQYREAMQAYLEARRLAQRLDRGELLAVVHTNLSSLYLQQQDVSAGARAAEEALQALRRAGLTKLGPQLRTQAAILYSRQGNMEAALPLFREALEEAEARGDPAMLGLIWDQLGYEFLTRGRPEEAERALVEGFRIRKLNRLADLQYSYYTLGILRLSQGDAPTARLLLDEAVSRLSKAPVTLALWRVYYERGRAAAQMGLSREALADFRQAVEHARRVRLEVLPTDSVWINTGVDQYQLYSALIRASATLYSETRDPAYAQLGFEAAEENRAAGLRALIFSPDEWRRRLPPDYWELLARLRALESRLLQRDDSAAREELGRLQYRLTEAEAEAGLSLFPRGQPGSGVEAGLLRRVQSAMQDGEAYFSFHLDEPESYLWVVTRRELHTFPLQGRRRLEPLAIRFLAAVARNRPEHTRLGQELYSALFGAVPERLLAAPRWSLALEGDLYEVPMAALVSSAPGAALEYLAERRAIRMVPSALLLERQRRQVRNRSFVGVGDPIYNAADERLRSGRRWGNLREIWRSGFGDGAELPRLPGSGGEIRACARVWGGGPDGSVVLTGQQASLEGLDRALKPGAAVVHFATHFLPSAAGAGQAMIALSLDAQGAPELLGPAEISRRRLDLDLAVLSGCASASGEAAPAEGLMGMTRAWLAAGARSVLATLWPTPDDQGRLLVSFYTHLAGLRDRGDGWAVPEALRSAQLDALRSGTPHGSPAYWGAYVLAGRE